MDASENTDKEVKGVKDPMENLLCIVDHSKVKRRFDHYLSVFIWIGWTFFYFILPGLSIFLYYYSPSILTALYGLMIISFVAPAEYRKQPKVGRCSTMNKVFSYPIEILDL